MAQGPCRVGARGFTLMELMIVLAVAGVILAIGAPNFRDFRMNNALTGAANDYLASLQLARTEAVKRQGIVSVCRSANPAADAAGCDGDDFSGWIVFDDPDGDCDRSDGERLIRGDGPQNASLQAPANGVCASFNRAGFSRELPVGMLADRLVFCDERGTALQAGTNQSIARGIIVDRTGRAQITRDQDIIESWGLACGGD